LGLLCLYHCTQKNQGWLFNNPKDPLIINNPLFLVGTAIYSMGYLFETGALHYFRITPIDQPVVGGPYHVSRTLNG
jgi:hypothetical protein